MTGAVTAISGSSIGITVVTLFEGQWQRRQQIGPSDNPIPASCIATGVCAGVGIDLVAVIAPLTSFKTTVSANRQFDFAEATAAVIVSSISIITLLTRINPTIPAGRFVATARATPIPINGVPVIALFPPLKNAVTTDGGTMARWCCNAVDSTFLEASPATPISIGQISIIASIPPVNTTIPAPGPKGFGGNHDDHEEKKKTGDSKWAFAHRT